MKFIAQFDIASDVSVTEDAANLSIRSPDGDFSLVVREVTLREGEQVAKLRCNMEFQSASLQVAKHDFIECVLNVLDMMSLLTHAKFEFNRLHKIFDWTPDKTTRSGLIFVHDPPEMAPERILDKKFFEAANLLQHAILNDRLLSALRWFRLGTIAEAPQEQFQNFWFSLELLSQHKKETDRVHDLCPKCREALYCKTCDTHPMHRPYPKQAIESVWKEIAPDKLELFHVMDKTRNKLMHGVAASKIEVITGVSLHELIDPLARVAWRGLISEAIASLPEDKRQKSLNVGVTNTFVKWDITAAINISTVIPLGPNGAPDIELLTGISAEFSSK